MTCGDVMTKNPSCCTPTDNAARVAKLMKTEDVGSIPVCESRQSKKVVGIVTDRDLTLRVVAEGRDPNSVQVQELMTKELFTCQQEDDLQKALDAMQKHQVRRIPVVDRNGQLIGIIALADIAIRVKQDSKTVETFGKISKPTTARAA